MGLKKKVPDAFCANGIEIDLKELEELERRVAAKKKGLLSSSQENRLEESFEKSLKISEETPAATSPSLASMLLVIMSIFSILNQIQIEPTAQS